VERTEDLILGVLRCRLCRARLRVAGLLRRMLHGKAYAFAVGWGRAPRRDVADPSVQGLGFLRRACGAAGQRKRDANSLPISRASLSLIQAA
jgi:hypothetical protein